MEAVLYPNLHVVYSFLLIHWFEAILTSLYIDIYLLCLGFNIYYYVYFFDSTFIYSLKLLNMLSSS